MSLFNRKPKSENLEELRDITDDVIEGDFVPYACHWDPHTLVTKNGEVLQIIKITGFTYEHLGTDDEDSDLRSKIREAVSECIGSTDYAVWIHTIRRKKSLQTGGEYKRDFAGYLNRFWNDRNDWEHQFTNEVYLTVVRDGENASIVDPKGFLRGIVPHIDIRHREQYLDESRDQLSAVVEKMLPILGRYGAHRLGIVKRGETFYSEPSEFLGKLITMLDLEFPVCDLDMADYLTDYDVTFGYNAMEVRMREDGRRRFGAMLTLKEYRELPLEPLERILQIPAEFVISQCFDFIHADLALKNYGYQKHLFDISKAKVLAEKTGLNDILGSNKGRPTDFGEHQLGIFLLADTLKSLESSVLKAVSALGSLGMLPLREDIKFEEGYWAQLPANFEFVKRMRPINTARIGGFANLSNFPAGQKENNHWGPAVTTFYTAARTPYFFNFHEGDNGHTTIIGPLGAGKTVLMNFLLSQARKFEGRLFMFDKNHASEIFVRSLGGGYVNPYPGSDKRPFAQVQFNPFALENMPENREFLADWMVMLAGGGDDPALSAVCVKAVNEVMQRPPTERSLGHAVTILSAQSPAFATLFSPWVGKGEHAALFDHVQDTFQLDEKINGFEMGEIIANPLILVPVLAYMLHAITLKLDGSPAIIVIDEAWGLLENPVFAARLAEWLEMLREHNAMVIFATENVEHARESNLNTILMKQISTQIYLPDEAADASYSEAFGLTEKEISYLNVMNTDDRHFLLKRGKDTIVAELNLSGMDDIIAVLSATPKHLDVMNRMIETYGHTPSQWMPKFLEMK